MKCNTIQKVHRGFAQNLSIMSSKIENRLCPLLLCHQIFMTTVIWTWPFITMVVFFYCKSVVKTLQWLENINRTHAWRKKRWTWPPKTRIVEWWTSLMCLTLQSMTVVEGTKEWPACRVMSWHFFFHSKGIHVTLDCVLKKKAAQVRITCSQEYDYVDFSLDMSDDRQTPMVLSKTYFVKPNGRSIFLLVKLHTSSSWFSRKTKNKYKKPTLFLSALFKILWRTSDKVSYIMPRGQWQRRFELLWLRKVTTLIRLCNEVVYSDFCSQGIMGKLVHVIQFFLFVVVTWGTEF